MIEIDVSVVQVGFQMPGRPFSTRQRNVFALRRALVAAGVVMAMIVVVVVVVVLVVGCNLRSPVMILFMRQMRMQADDTPGQEDRADGYKEGSAPCHAKSIAHVARRAYAAERSELEPFPGAGLRSVKAPSSGAPRRS